MQHIALEYCVKYGRTNSVVCLICLDYLVVFVVADTNIIYAVSRKNSIVFGNNRCDTDGWWYS